MSQATEYPSDLTDAQWAMLEPLLYPQRPTTGRPPRVDRRAVVNAILYVLRTGCQWRALPRDYPNWITVYWYFKRWRDAGRWEQVNDTLRRQLRVQAGRDPEPSAAIADSQSVKTTEKGAIGASMAASSSRAASATSWWTPPGC